MTESHRNNSGQRTGPPHIMRGMKRRHRYQLQQGDLEGKHNEVCHRQASAGRKVPQAQVYSSEQHCTLPGHQRSNALFQPSGTERQGSYVHPNISSNVGGS